MDNIEVIERLKAGKDAILRSSLTLLVQGHKPEDIVQVLSEVIDDHADAYARRTGDYDGASCMKLIAQWLEGLDSFVDNYDGAPNE